MFVCNKLVTGTHDCRRYGKEVQYIRTKEFNGEKYEHTVEELRKNVLNLLLS